LLDALDVLFKDNVKGRRLNADGVWKVPPRAAADPAFIAQLALYEQTRRAWEKREAVPPATFEPLTAAR
jgi:hypothetical protein